MRGRVPRLARPESTPPLQSAAETLISAISRTSRSGCSQRGTTTLNTSSHRLTCDSQPAGGTGCLPNCPSSAAAAAGGGAEWSRGVKLIALSLSPARRPSVSQRRGLPLHQDHHLPHLDLLPPHPTSHCGSARVQHACRPASPDRQQGKQSWSSRQSRAREAVSEQLSVTLQADDANIWHMADDANIWHHHTHHASICHDDTHLNPSMAQADSDGPPAHDSQAHAGPCVALGGCGAWTQRRRSVSLGEGLDLASVLLLQDDQSVADHLLVDDHAVWDDCVVVDPLVAPLMQPVVAAASHQEALYAQPLPVEHGRGTVEQVRRRLEYTKSTFAHSCVACNAAHDSCRCQQPCPLCIEEAWMWMQKTLKTFQDAACVTGAHRRKQDTHKSTRAHAHAHPSRSLPSSPQKSPSKRPKVPSHTMLHALNPPPPYLQRHTEKTRAAVGTGAAGAGAVGGHTGTAVLPYQLAHTLQSWGGTQTSETSGLAQAQRSSSQALLRSAAKCAMAGGIKRTSSSSLSSGSRYDANVSLTPHTCVPLFLACKKLCLQRPVVVTVPCR